MGHCEIQTRPLILGVGFKIDDVQKELCALPKLPAIPTKLELNAPMLVSADMWIPYPCKVMRSAMDGVAGTGPRPDQTKRSRLSNQLLQTQRFSSPHFGSAAAKRSPGQLSLIQRADSSSAGLRVQWIGSTKCHGSRPLVPCLLQFYTADRRFIVVNPVFVAQHQYLLSRA
jgi:hypothetical protein